MIELLKKAKKNPEIAKNVREINITLILLGIAEKIAKDQMDDHYYHTDYYYRKQYGDSSAGNDFTTDRKDKFERNKKNLNNRTK